ncbi:hypothetical protein [Rhizobium sp. 22-785-1]
MRAVEEFTETKGKIEEGERSLKLMVRRVRNWSESKALTWARKVAQGAQDENALLNCRVIALLRNRMGQYRLEAMAMSELTT